jgi:hypothetical protein
MRWSTLLIAAACTPKLETGTEAVDLAPEIAFTSPADDASFAAGRSVTLAVSLSDEEVPALDLAWSSTVSGPLVGEEIRNSTSASLTLPSGLTVGSHTITVTATDAAGQSAFDTVVLTVTDGADGDLDGWGADDCDDADPNVHPGAAERCDGVDQDCDKEIDEGATDAVTVHVDLDGDGFGAGPGALGCVGAGSSLNDDDCDDADAAISPDGVEVCDAELRDEDCDGLVNGDDPDSAGGEVNTWYPDADGDGFGADAGSVEACSPPSGYVAAGGDCDDADATVSPAEPEVCDAADVDEDCDGAADDDDASVSDADAWYADDDGDGYGGGSPVVSCDPVPGASPVGGDCDDADPEHERGRVAAHVRHDVRRVVDRRGERGGGEHDLTIEPRAYPTLRPSVRSNAHDR